MKKLLFFLCIFLLLSTYSLSAKAGTHFNIMRFYPNPDGGRFFHLLDSRTLYQWQFAAGTMISYGYQPLEMKDSPRKIVKNLLEQHVFATVGFVDWLEMSVDMPVALMDDFIDPVPVTEPSSKWKVSVGDVKVMFKGQILDRDKYPVGLAIAPFVTAPTGKEAYYLGEDGFSGGGDLILDGQIGEYVTLALNGGVEFGKKVVFRNIDRGKVSIRLGAGANIKATKDLSFSLEGFVRSSTNHFFKDRVHTPAEVIGGAQYRIGNTGLIINAGGGAGLIKGIGAPSFRGFAGLTYKHMTDDFVARDAERAALKGAPAALSELQLMVVELREKCPPPAMFNPDIDDPRCPKYYELRELSDLVIKCPSRPEDFNELVHDQRCMKVYSMAADLSREDMSVVYAMSTVELSLRCPENPEEYKAGVHDKACPKYYDLKIIAAYAGSCPASPEDFNPAVHDQACQKIYVLKSGYSPEAWSAIVTLSEEDRDHDGVPDLYDRCPDVSGEIARKGCPAEAAYVAGEILRTAQPIEFAFNSYSIKPEMMPVIRDVAEALAANPNLRLMIEGYADSVGDMWANIWISEMRATRVRDALDKMGFDGNRIVIEGKGSTSRFASNQTEEGRKMNRRVMFFVISK